MHCRDDLAFEALSPLRLLDQAVTLEVLLLAVLLQADGHDRDEAGGVGGLEVSDLVHAGLAGAVEDGADLALGGAAKDGERALVDTASDGTVDVLLGGLDGFCMELD